MNIWLNWDEINIKAWGKKVVCWGKNDFRMGKVHKYLAGDVAYIVGNSSYVQKYQGMDINSIMVLGEQTS